MSDLIDRQAALDALGERPVVWSDNDDYTLGERNQYDMDRLAIETVPSAQPECEDTVYRKAVQMLLAYFVPEERYAEAVDGLRGLPSAQPEQSSEIQDILEYLDTVLHPIISPDHWNVYSELHDMISMLPSAQPEIIHCKDCKFFSHGYCRFHDAKFVRPDGYCYWGEQKEGEQHD